MIEVQKTGHRTVAAIVCDVCREPITNVGMALVKYPAIADGESTATLLFCHKDDCDQRSENGAAGRPWMELNHFLAKLLLSSGMPLAAIADAMRGVEILQSID